MITLSQIDVPDEPFKGDMEEYRRLLDQEKGDSAGPDVPRSKSQKAPAPPKVKPFKLSTDVRAAQEERSSPTGLPTGERQLWEAEEARARLAASAGKAHRAAAAGAPKAEPAVAGVELNLSKSVVVGELKGCGEITWDGDSYSI